MVYQRNNCSFNFGYKITGKNRIYRVFLSMANLSDDREREQKTEMDLKQTRLLEAQN